MQIINKIKAFYRKEQFMPSFFSIVINSNYFVRSGIYSGIKKHANLMTGTMLDFGCGRKPYRDLFEVKKYIGVDIENTGHLNDTSLVDFFYNGRILPFESEYFDSVFSSEVLTHIFKLEPIIKEINRVLKMNGNVLITVPFVWHENEKPNDAIRFTSFGIENLFARNGFEIIAVEKKGTYFTTVLQMWNSFLYHVIFPKHVLVKLLLTVLFIFPVNLIGLLFSYILPKNTDLFNNTILVAKKKVDIGHLNAL